MMMIIPEVISIIASIAPSVAKLLSKKNESVVSVVSSLMGGVNMNNIDDVMKALKNNDTVDKLKELELQLGDLKDAREQAEKETGAQKLVRPLLAIVLMIALAVDIYLIQIIEDTILNQVLVMLLVFLIWDIRQVYKFYFGNTTDLPDVFYKIMKRKF